MELLSAGPVAHAARLESSPSTSVSLVDLRCPIRSATALAARKMSSRAAEARLFFLLAGRFLSSGSRVANSSDHNGAKPDAVKEARASVQSSTKHFKQSYPTRSVCFRILTGSITHSFTRPSQSCPVLSQMPFGTV